MRYNPGTDIAGRFEILGDVGEGGMGAVYKARQISLDRIVALKVLHSTVAFTPRARRRFGREARAIARLNHPHIASVFDFGTDDVDQTLWLAMEYIEGKGMSGLKRAPIDVLRLLSLADQTCSALSAAHARDIIHRDLKPSNILITKNNEGQEMIKLVDFGLAATQEGELSLVGAPGGLEGESEVASKGIMGTPRYMAPEIFRRKPVDPKVDLYALGIILFEIIAGTPPYPGSDPKQIMRGHLRGPIPQLIARDNVEIPPELERIIYKLLAKNPEERYQTAAEVREALMSIIGDFSYVPWAMGPSLGDLNQTGFMGNRSGFLSNFGGQTVPPSAMLGNSSRVGAMSAPLVGRQKERRIIEKKIGAVTFQGEGGLVFVEGETGIGKSKLAEWIQVRVVESGMMRAVSGYFSPQRSGFDGIRMVLDELLGTSELSYTDVEYAIQAKLKNWGFSETDILTCVELMSPGGDVSLLEGKEEGNTFARMATQIRLSRRERVFAVIEQIFRRLTSTRPLLLVFEDLHNANATTFSFLEHLAVGLHLNPFPILVFSTLRSEALAQNRDLAETLRSLSRFNTEVSRVFLHGMSVEESVMLVKRLIPVDTHLATQLANQSGGNAMHLVQIIRYLQETEKLYFHNGEWKVKAGIEIQKEVPQELRDLLRHRLDQVCRLYDDARSLRAIVNRCAILGRQVDYRLIHAFVKDEPTIQDLDGGLEFLVKHSILREIGYSTEDKLEFYHAVMRDVILADIALDRSTRALHRNVAELKFAFYGKRASAHAQEIAEHYRHAKDVRGVYRFVVKGARAAFSSSNLTEAIKLYREAKSIADRTPDLDFPAETRGLDEASSVLRSSEVALELAHLELRLGEYHSARSHYRVLLRDPSKEVASWARWGLGALALEQGELEEAIGWFDATQREGDKLNQGGKIVTSSLLGKGRIEFLQGKLESASSILKIALDKAQKLKLREHESDILRVLADVTWIMGNEDSDVYRRRATILAETTNDAEALAHSTFQAALFHRRGGSTKRATELLSTSMEMFEELGKRHLLAHCLVEDGRLRLGQGNLKIAASTLREALKLYEGFNDRRGVTACKLVLAELAFSISKRREAKRFIDDALDGYRVMGDRRGQAYCKLLMGEIALSVGKPQSGVFKKLMQNFVEIGDIRGELTTAALLVSVLISENQARESKTTLKTLFHRLEDIEVVSPSFARALDRIASSLNSFDPSLAFAVDGRAEMIWKRLGRK